MPVRKAARPRRAALTPFISALIVAGGQEAGIRERVVPTGLPRWAVNPAVDGLAVYGGPDGTDARRNHVPLDRPGARPPLLLQDGHPAPG